jgi:hypothetical protein
MRTILCTFALIGLLHAEARRWKLHPAVDAAVEQVKIGELTSIRGPDSAVGAADEQARNEYLKAQKANDKEGIKELSDAGKITVLEESTEVRVLERNEADLDKLMSTVHILVDIDRQAWKECMERNVRRAAAGLPSESCGDAAFETMYNRRFSQCLDGGTPEAYVDTHVLVFIRVLSGKESGRKFWVPYRSLSRPSKPDPSVKAQP